MTEDITRDFDIFNKPKRFAVVAGEKIDVSRIPTIVQIKIAELNKREKGMSKEEKASPERFLELIDIIALACAKNPKITKDWLIENTDMEQLLDLMQFILEPLKARAEKKGESEGVKTETEQ